jgi:hypothetical protein
MTVHAQYAAKRVTAAEAIRNVHNGDTIVVPTAVAEPPALLSALSEHRRDFRDVKVSQILAVRKFGYLDRPPPKTCATWPTSSAAPRVRASRRAWVTSTPATSPRCRSSSTAA